MKLIPIILIAVAVTTFVACNNSDTSSNEKAPSNVGTDTAKMVRADSVQMTELTHAFATVDPKLGVSFKTVVDHYLHIKNGLVNNSGKEAANGGEAMAEALSKIDKSLFTAEQKKVYVGIEDDLKEHAEHIGENAANIKHQREHFSMMSEDVYDLVKAFGAGRALYHDHCPMANDNKGAMWLSETKEVKNPYFGGKMNDCVTVPEVIK